MTKPKDWILDMQGCCRGFVPLTPFLPPLPCSCCLPKPHIQLILNRSRRKRGVGSKSYSLRISNFETLNKTPGTVANHHTSLPTNSRIVFQSWAIPTPPQKSSPWYTAKTRPSSTCCWVLKMCHYHRSTFDSLAYEAYCIHLESYQSIWRFAIRPEWADRPL